MKIVFLNIYQNSVDRGSETFVREVSKRLGKNNQIDVFYDKEDNIKKRWPSH